MAPEFGCHGNRLINYPKPNNTKLFPGKFEEKSRSRNTVQTQTFVSNKGFLKVLGGVKRPPPPPSSLNRVKQLLVYFYKLVLVLLYNFLLFLFLYTSNHYNYSSFLFTFLLLSLVLGPRALFS